MMARPGFTLIGDKELTKTLTAIADPRARKGIARHSLRKGAKPIAETAGRLAPRRKSAGGPEREEELHESIAVSSRLSKRQKKRRGKAKAEVEIFVGTTALPHAHLQEFGWEEGAPQPYLRPAWDGGKRQALKDILKESWKGIERRAKRLARKARKAAAG